MTRDQAQRRFNEYRAGFCRGSSSPDNEKPRVEYGPHYLRGFKDGLAAQFAAMEFEYNAILQEDRDRRATGT